MRWRWYRYALVLKKCIARFLYSLKIRITNASSDTFWWNQSASTDWTPLRMGCHAHHFSRFVLSANSPTMKRRDFHEASSYFSATATLMTSWPELTFLRHSSCKLNSINYVQRVDFPSKNEQQTVKRSLPEFPRNTVSYSIPVRGNLRVTPR